MHWFLQGESLKFIGTPYWYLNSVSSSVSSHRLLISGCHQKLWIGTVGSDFLFSQDSHPASGDLKPCAHVEVFLSRDHVDVNALLEWQLSRHLAVSITVVYSHLTGSATANFFRVPLLQASWCSLSLELPSGLPDIGLATTARFPIHDLGLLLHWHGIFNLESTKQSNCPDLKTTCFPYSCNSFDVCWLLLCRVQVWKDHHRIKWEETTEIDRARQCCHSWRQSTSIWSLLKDVSTGTKCEIPEEFRYKEDMLQPASFLCPEED